MLLVYDNDNQLHLINSTGLRWNYERADKPDLGFDYDYLFYNPTEDETFEIQGNVFPLSQEQIDSIEEYINLAEPPDICNLQNQFTDDLKHHIFEQFENGFFGDLGYNGWGDLLITAREGSNDPYRAEARRCLEFRDFVMQSYYRLREEILASEDADLLPFEDYIGKLPIVPQSDWFSRGDRPIAERLQLLADSDTLDINGGEDSRRF